jgi:hypothetical protein
VCEREREGERAITATPKHSKLKLKNRYMDRAASDNKVRYFWPDSMKNSTRYYIKGE